jgi:HEAT repeat protein
VCRAENTLKCKDFRAEGQTGEEDGSALNLTLGIRASPQCRTSSYCHVTGLNLVDWPPICCSLGRELQKSGAKEVTGMRRWIFRVDPGVRAPCLPILLLLYLAGTLATPSRGTAQESTDIVSLNLRDLRSKDASVRARAATNLGNNASPGSPANDRQQARRAIPALVDALKDSDQSVRGAAALALGNIPGDMRICVPPLIEALRDKDDQVRARAADALGRIGQSPELAVPALVSFLQEDSGSRYFSSDALIRFGPAARTAVPTLIDLLKGDDPSLPWYAAQVLGAIGPDAQAAVPALTNMLQATNDQEKLEAADALAKIGRNQLEAVSIPARLLEAADYRDRARAAAVLGDFGAVAEPSVPALTKALNDENGAVRRIAATSLSRIATALRDGRRTEAVEPLQRAATAMEQSPDPQVKARAQINTGAITTLREIRRHDLKWQLLRPFREQPHVAFPIAGYLALALLWTCLLWLWPISLLKVNQALDPIPKVRLPGWLGGIEVSISHLLLVGFFRYPDRVLDAWVLNVVEKGRAFFESNPTTAKSADAVAGPILLAGEELPALSVSALQPAFARSKARLLIWGSDADRNRNLACEIARWSMEPDPKKRLRKNLMIAVLLDQNFVHTVGKDSDPFTQAVRDNLQLDMDEEAPSLDLVARLLKRQRVLVVVLGLSELDPTTQSSIQPGNADFPANALVVTSRVHEALGSTGNTVIQPVEENRI